MHGQTAHIGPCLSHASVLYPNQMREFFIRGGGIYTCMCHSYTIDTIDHLLGVWGYAFPEKKIKGSEF